MLNGGENKIVDLGTGRQEEAGEEAPTANATSNAAQDWPWDLTPASATVLGRAHTYAHILKHREAKGEHLLAMLALDEAGRGEIEKRGYDAEGAFRAAYSVLMLKVRLTHDNSLAKAGTSADLNSIMVEAEAIAQGCEAVPRAVATSDIVAAIVERPSEDAIKTLLMGRITPSASEQARDGVQAVGRLLAEELALLRDRIGEAQQESASANGRVGSVEFAVAANTEKLRSVEALSARTANDNDVRWARTKKAMFAMVALIVSASVLTAIDGGRSLRIVVAWLANLIV